MNFDFLDRRSAEHFAELLDESSGGRRHHTARGPADEQLAELVAVGHSLSAARPGVRVDPEFRVGLRAMLVATAERDGIGRTAVAAAAEAVPDSVAAPAPTRSKRAGSRFAILGLGGSRIRARGAIVLGVAAGAMAVSGISAASENAAPGDALYGVKRSTERAQLAMAGSDVTRGKLSLDFARTRLTEAAAMAGDNSEFGSVLDDMDNDTRKGVGLLTTSAVAQHDARTLTTVETFATGQQRTFSPVLSRLSDTNRTRALASISLLNAVQQRVDELRGGLSCTSVTSIGSDMLGPKLKSCPAQPNSNTSTGRTTTGRSGKLSGRAPEEGAPVHPKRTGAATTPDLTGDGETPDRPDASTAADTSDEVEPNGIAPNGIAPNGLLPSSAVPIPASTVDKGKGALGGLLGGILGSD